MKKLAFVLGALLSPPVAIADIAPISPDFVGSAPRRHIDHSLVTSTSMNRIEPLDVIAFDLDSPHLAGETIAQVDRAAKWLLRHTDHRVVLEGHTDQLGRSPYNADLASRRMHAVRNRLMGWGVPSDRIVMLSYGETHAIVPNNPEDRRVVMFATDAPLRQIVATQLQYRHALIATWSERGRLLQLRSGLGGEPVPPSKSAVSRR